MSESPDGSPLSDLMSDTFEGDEEHEGATMPPTKRQKRESVTPAPLPGDISSDSETDLPPNVVPNSLSPDEDYHEQVRVCLWEDCEAGDLGNMDELVIHIHNEHIESRQKKYTCEWKECPRKSKPHASGYALKAHMRSHTREKPFYCVVPECDRAFTRSDALAKHMRTVHETEALRPSDPIPKMDPAKASRLKLIIKKSEEAKAESPQPNGTSVEKETIGWTSSYPPELGFTAEEEARGSKDLYSLLRRQIKWAEDEAESLKVQSDSMEELRKEEWLEKEVLLDQVIKHEASWHDRRQMVLAEMEASRQSQAQAANATQEAEATQTVNFPTSQVAEAVPVLAVSS